MARDGTAHHREARRQMKRLYQVPDDFEAVIRIYSHEEGGRRTPPFNGIRWDFGYADDPPGSSIYMIMPDFFDEHGRQPMLVRILNADGHLELSSDMRACADDSNQ